MELRTDKRTDDPNTRCPRQNFLAGGIKMNRASTLIINNLHTKWLGKNCSLYRAHKVSQTESPKLTFDLMTPKSTGLLLSSSSDWAKTVICIMPTRFYTQSANIKRLLPRCIHHFKSDIINNMNHMRISGNEPSSVILRKIHVKWFQRKKMLTRKCQNKLKPKGMV